MNSQEDGWFGGDSPKHFLLLAKVHWGLTVQKLTEWMAVTTLLSFLVGQFLKSFSLVSYWQLEEQNGFLPYLRPPPVLLSMSMSRCMAPVLSEQPRACCQSFQSLAWLFLVWISISLTLPYFLKTKGLFDTVHIIKLWKNVSYFKE